MAQLWQQSITLALLAVLWAGCGGSDAAPSAMAGGTMRLVSVEPLDGSGGANFIDNGDFSMWWAGAPAPERFIPPAPRFSQVKRVSDAATGRYGIEQQWLVPDFEEEAPSLLRVSALGLRPATQYQLEITGRRLAPGPISLSVYEERPGGRLALLGESPTMEIAAPIGVVKFHQVAFTTELGGVIHLRANGGRGAGIVWYEWAIRQ